MYLSLMGLCHAYLIFLLFFFLSVRLIVLLLALCFHVEYWTTYINWRFLNPQIAQFNMWCMCLDWQGNHSGSNTLSCQKPRWSLWGWWVFASREFSRGGNHGTWNPTAGFAVTVWHACSSALSNLHNGCLTWWLMVLISKWTESASEAQEGATQKDAEGTNKQPW